MKGGDARTTYDARHATENVQPMTRCESRDAQHRAHGDRVYGECGGASLVLLASAAIPGACDSERVKLAGECGAARRVRPPPGTALMRQSPPALRRLYTSPMEIERLAVAAARQESAAARRRTVHEPHIGHAQSAHRRLGAERRLLSYATVVAGLRDAPRAHHAPKCTQSSPEDRRGAGPAAMPPCPMRMRTGAALAASRTRLCPVAWTANLNQGPVVLSCSASVLRNARRKGKPRPGPCTGMPGPGLPPEKPGRVRPFSPPCHGGAITRGLGGGLGASCRGPASASHVVSGRQNGGRQLS
jgi:hypothetical protein